MNKKKSIIALIIILLIIPTITSLVNIQNNTEAINSPGEKQEPINIEDPINIELKEPKSSAGGWDYYELHIDDTGASGNGTWAWTASTYAWCTDVNGDGSLYVIEDITLNRSDTPGSSLIIANSTRSFIIQNCTISNSGSGSINNGISLLNASNGKIIDCKIFDNNYGIFLDDDGGDDSKDNIIKNNTIDSNSMGIFFESGSDDNDIINNTITNHNSYSVYLYFADASLIENNTIDGGSRGIFLQYADNVVARNNTIIGSNYGILFHDTLNLELSGNTMQDCGIVWEGSSETELKSSTIYKNNTANAKPVYFYKDQNGLDTNNFTSEGAPGQIILANCSYSTISNFNLSYTSAGIQLYYSEHNNISSNFCRNNYLGIYLYFDNDNNTIYNNTILYSLDKGIYLTQDCGYNNISYNDVRFSTGHGIHFTTRCENNTIFRNNISANEDNGIWIGGDSQNNTIMENEIRDNGDGGIMIFDCNRTYIANNDIIHNSYGAGGAYGGIALDYASSYSNITGNSILENDDWGIRLHRADYNNISRNVIRDNENYGIYFSAESTFCDYNLIYLNFFKGNTLWHVYIPAVSTGNELEYNGIGNWWDNYSGVDTTPEDGIGDTPHSPVPVGDEDPNPIVDDTAPVITIIDPNAGNKFNDNAPQFNVIVVEKYLYKMWYNLDNGITNVTFTKNGTIDQELWADLPNGYVNLTFWIEDKTGKIGSDVITVIKVPSGAPIADDDDDDDDDGAEVIEIPLSFVLIFGVIILAALIIVIMKLRKR